MATATEFSWIWVVLIWDFLLLTWNLDLVVMQTDCSTIHIEYQWISYSMAQGKKAESFSFPITFWLSFCCFSYNLPFSTHFPSRWKLAQMKHRGLKPSRLHVTHSKSWPLYHPPCSSEYDRGHTQGAGQIRQQQCLGAQGGLRDSLGSKMEEK